METNKEAAMPELKTIPSVNFTYYPLTKRFVAEASDLETYFPYNLPKEFNIQSVKTGKVVTFGFRRFIRDDEGDVLVTEYVPCDEWSREQPDLANVTLHVLND